MSPGGTLNKGVRNGSGGKLLIQGLHLGRVQGLVAADPNPILCLKWPGIDRDQRGDNVRAEICLGSEINSQTGIRRNIVRKYGGIPSRHCIKNSRMPED